MNQSTILSSHYFPCIAYFSVLLKAQSTVIDLGEHFVKQSYRNRCIIYGANGKLPLSIPVIKRNKTAVKEVLIDTDKAWKATHWKAISSAYNSSPFFEFYADELKEVLFKEYSHITELNKALLNHLCKEIGITTSLEYSSKYIDAVDTEHDYRHLLHPKKEHSSLTKFPRYIQIFENKHGYIYNLSILDLLFHEGPETLSYLQSLKF